MSDGHQIKPKKKPGFETGFFVTEMMRLLFDKAVEFLFETADTPGTVHKMATTAGPGRVRGWINIQRQSVTFRTVCGSGVISRTIGQGDRNGMIIGVDIALHLFKPEIVDRSRLINFALIYPIIATDTSGLGYLE